MIGADIGVREGREVVHRRPWRTAEAELRRFGPMAVLRDLALVGKHLQDVVKVMRALDWPAQGRSKLSTVRLDRGGAAPARFSRSDEFHRAVLATWSASGSWRDEEACSIEELERERLRWWLTLGGVHGGQRRGDLPIPAKQLMADG